MRRILITIAAALAVLVAGVAPALADSCANVSRAAPQGWTPATVYSAPLLKGGWVWLPSLTSVFGPNAQFPPFWGKVTPGTADAVLLGAPGQNGNYTNGKTISLLGVSALCRASQAFVVRQTDHGIQSGCE